MAVSAGSKTLLAPQPKLQTAFFSTIEAAANIPAGVQLMVACTSSGAAKSGEPVGLNVDLKVDLIVIGSRAVDPTTGARQGKGEVYFSKLCSSFLSLLSSNLALPE